LFRIDKSFAESININKEFVVITPKEVFDHVQKQITEEKRPQAAGQQDVLALAEAQAERIVQQAKSDADGIRERARQEGYREGREQAQKEMEALIRAQAEDAKQVFSKLGAYKQELYRDLYDNVLALSFDIAEKIINIQLKRDDTIYVEIAKAAIQALNSSSKFALAREPY
jgi:flagellar assembly protein FliH